MYRKLREFVPIRAKPPWLPLATELPARSLRARHVSGVLRLWLTFDQGRQQLIDLQISTPGLRRRVASKDAKWIDCDPALVSRWRADVVAFSERLAWVQGALRGETVQTRHQPSEQERDLASLYRLVQQGGAGIMGVTPSSTAAANSLELRAYLAVAHSDWRTIFTLTDEAPETIPSWVRPLVFAVSGDTARLRACVEGEREDNGVLGVFEGLALKQMQCVQPAYEAIQRGLTGLDAAERSVYYVPFAELAEKVEGEALAIRCLVGAITGRRGDDKLMMRAISELLRYGAFPEVSRLLLARADKAPPHYEVFETLAVLASWCGQLDEARAWANKALALRPEQGVGARRVIAICDALAGDTSSALASLLEIDTQADAETRTWIAELLIREGDTERATYYLNHAKSVAQTVAHGLLQALLDGALYANAYPKADPKPLDEVRTVLASFHGNRREVLTQTPDAAPGHARDLTLVRVPADNMLLVSRNAAANHLRTIRFRTPESLHEGFAAIVEQYPESPHPWCYWGELRLWLGEIDEADACFRQPQARAARWAYVGRAAVHVHRHEFEAALAEFERLSRAYDPVPGATKHVYAGELYRIRGEFELALTELDVGLDAKPSRVGAHINKALCLLALGRSDEAATIGDELRESYPRLFWDVARSLGLSWPCPQAELATVLEQALRLMRGNRSSHTVTYFDSAGMLRILEDARAWSRFAVERRALVEREIQGRLMLTSK